MKVDNFLLTKEHAKRLKGIQRKRNRPRLDEYIESMAVWLFPDLDEPEQAGAG